MSNKNDLESDVEDELFAWGSNNGWYPRFMQYRGRRGCRDMDFVGYGRIVPIEFKRPGRAESGLSENQKRERKRFADVGVTIHVIDNLEDGIALLRSFM